MFTLHTYQGCSTCRAAVKWLNQQGIAFEELPIREKPPGTQALSAALRCRGGDLRALFNTSGRDYRALGLKDKLPGMSEGDAVALLAGNGNLVKRPFAYDLRRGVHLIGFRQDEWQAALA